MNINNMKLAVILMAIGMEIEENPTRWITGASARDKEGNSVGVRERAAVCWCAAGFTVRDLFGKLINGYFEAIDVAGKLMSRLVGWDGGVLSYNWQYIDYNDAPGRTAPEVAALFKKAGEILEQNPDHPKPWLIPGIQGLIDGPKEGTPCPT